MSELVLFEARQRRSARRAVSVPCQVVREPGFVLLADRTVDLSAEGALVHSAIPVPLGEPVLVSLRLPGGLSWIDAEAVVRRVILGRRGSDAGCALALRFDRIDAIDRALLLASIEGLPPPVPARLLRRDYARTVASIARAA